MHTGKSERPSHGMLYYNARWGKVHVIEYDLVDALVHALNTYVIEDAEAAYALLCNSRFDGDSLASLAISVLYLRPGSGAVVELGYAVMNYCICVDNATIVPDFREILFRKRHRDPNNDPSHTCDAETDTEADTENRIDATMDTESVITTFDAATVDTDAATVDTKADMEL